MKIAGSLLIVSTLGCGWAWLSAAGQGSADTVPKVDYTGWAAYGGTADQVRYSSLRQINRANVKQLQVAWRYDTREAGGLQTQPILADGVLDANPPTPQPVALGPPTR